MKKKLLLITILVLGIFLTACGSEEKEKTVENVIKSGNYTVLDVRTKEEYETGHVKGSLNIPYDTINANTKIDKDKPVLVYCKSGVRSAKAYETLKNLGYEVYDLGAYEKVTLEKE